MKYANLPIKEKQTINGKISQFMDVYIRKNQVWFPEDMFRDFLQDISHQHLSGYWYSGTDPVRTAIIKNSLQWILSVAGQDHVLGKIKAKHAKDTDIAIRQNPITERVRFGDWPDNHFDIGYGLKGRGSERMKIEELRELNVTPWTVDHINHGLKSKYGKDLKQIYRKFPFGHLEIDFFSHWFSNYYDTDKPALIPKVNALRGQFGYITYKGEIYQNSREIGEEWYLTDFRFERYKYDFMLINIEKKVACFIDIFPINFPLTNRDKKIVKIKGENAKEYNFKYFCFEQDAIKSELQDCFDQLKVYLGK